MKLFILGGTGDLVKRKVLPALNELNKPIEIISLGRETLTSSNYLDLIKIPKLNKKIRYVQVDFNENDLFKPILSILDKADTNFFYVALPPFLLDQVFTELGKLKGYPLKILVEKPFGTSLVHAEKLQSIIKKYNLDVLISDHYLFKKNILHLKKKDFSKFKIVSLEKLKLEGRASYYDSAGALKDMVQSHFLNITFKLFDNFSDFKIISYERKQYDGYAEELGRSSDTETFIHLILESNGKTFEFITGKAFVSKESYLELDGKRIEIDSSENPYVEMFSKFFDSITKDFPTVEQTYSAWKIIDTVLRQKTKLGHYTAA